MTYREMIKVAVGLSEFRKVWKGVRGSGVMPIREKDVPPVFGLFHLASDVATRKPSQYSPFINIPRLPKHLRNETNSPVAQFMHEAGHAADPTAVPNMIKHLQAGTSETMREKMLDEISANRNVKGMLSPASYAKVQPSLRDGFKSYTTKQPFEAAISNLGDNYVPPKWTQNIPHSDYIESPNGLRVLRKRLSKTDPTFKAQFKDTMFKNQDLLKQTP